MGETLGLHPAAASWFAAEHPAPTPIQAASWPLLGRGGHALLVAPTGTGKTLAAFLGAISRLLEEPPGPPGVRVVYVSPLRALSSDIHANLLRPLEGIARRAPADRAGLLRAGLRTGDSTPAERRRLLDDPPGILVTTPESLHVLLGSTRGRGLLAPTRILILDELHAIVESARGAHLALSAARLEALAGGPLQRIGLSATANPPEALRAWLRGQGPLPELVVDPARAHLDLALELPRAGELSAVLSGELLAAIVRRIVELSRDHRSTLVFVNTRRLAERLAHLVEEAAPELPVAAHHGSISGERRRVVEARLREGALRLVVATASLELGIDVGAVELVVQVGSPRRISTLVQRVGRAGHRVGGRPRGRVVPTTREELLECAAAVRAAREGRIEAFLPWRAHRDVLLQALAAEAAARPLDERAIQQLLGAAEPYRRLPEAELEALLAAGEEGLETPAGRRGALWFRDGTGRELRARRGTGLVARIRGGTIPDHGDYRVVREEDGAVLGTVGEDFAVECAQGDVFRLGTRALRVLRVREGELFVADAPSGSGSIPFWVGEAPGRSPELSRELSELRAELLARTGEGPEDEEPRAAALGLAPAELSAAASDVERSRAALGCLPAPDLLVAERFFDGTGGQQLVLHAPLGVRLLRALGFLLRKRLCRGFDEELQAQATDDGVAISLRAIHAFPLEALRGLLTPGGAREDLIQALLLSPMFRVRFRWCAARALFLGGPLRKGRIPFPLQRFQAEDLLAATFPALTACQEHQEFPLPVPDHPLVVQALEDALHEAVDAEGLGALLQDLAAGRCRLHTVESTQPSPFAESIVQARPFAFLDEAPLEERRSRTTPRAVPGGSPRLRPEVLTAFAASERMPADEAGLRERLADCGLLIDPPSGISGLQASGEAVLLWLPDGRPAAVRKRDLEVAQALLAGEGGVAATHVSHLTRWLRGRLAHEGPTTIAELAVATGLAPAQLEEALAPLLAAGTLIRGRFREGAEGVEICDRAVLARLHRMSLEALRAEVEATSPQVLWCRLAREHGLRPLGLLTGSEARALDLRLLSLHAATLPAWRRGLLEVRGGPGAGLEFDRLLHAGTWRLVAAAGTEEAQAHRGTRFLLVGPEAEDRCGAGFLLAPSPPVGLLETGMLEELQAGPRSLLELAARTGRLLAEVEEAARGLVARGLVTVRGLFALQRLIDPRGSRSPARAARSRGQARIEAFSCGTVPEERGAEAVASVLLCRYGVLGRELLERACGPGRRRALVAALRRLELRGVVRTGGFVKELHPEQWARPGFADSLRREAAAAAAGPILLHHEDPLQLGGLLIAWEDEGSARDWVVVRDGRARPTATPSLPLAARPA